MSTAFDGRGRPRRLPITLSEHARRASWAPIGAADVSRCERTAPSREDQNAPRTARPALAVATPDGRRRRPTRVGAGPSPTRRRRRGRRRAEVAPGLVERPRPQRVPPARFASTTRETRSCRLDDGQSGSGCQGVDQSHMTKTVPAADGRSNHVPAVRVWSLNQPAY